MELLKKICCKIMEELRDASCYVKMAVRHKSNHAAIAKTLYDISVDELNHAAMLDSAAKTELARYENTEEYAAAHAVYDFMHEQYLEDVAEIKAMQAQYRE